MALKPQRREELVTAIAEAVPGMTLREIVREQGVVDDFDELRKAVPQDPERAARQIVHEVMARYEAVQRLRNLVEGIWRRCQQDDRCYNLLVPFVTELTAPAAGQQAAIARRAHTLRGPELRRFMASIESKLCVIACVSGVQRSLGTGVLVGPDLVLTAYHTLRAHIDNGQQRQVLGAALYAFFDHCDAGPIDDPEDPAITALRVPFAAHWLVAWCRDMPEEATIRDATPAEVEALKNNLDFALVRLDVPIGNQSRDRATGGERRAWCELRAPQAYRADDRIIIPQHPQGHAQQIDFGRYSEPGSKLDKSETRIRYNTETDDGTSGAPCFNQFYQFAGLHTAAFMPGGVAAGLNQAARGDRILHRLNGLLPAPAAAGPAAPDGAAVPVATTNLQPSRLWNAAAAQAAARPILGRKALLDWIARAGRDQLAGLEARVHIAAGAQPRSGRSFSTDILLAARRGAKKDVFVSLGNGDQIPATVEDFLRAVAYQLRLSATDLQSMPARPGLATALPGGAQALQSDADKLAKWTADDMPLWFARLLQQCRSYTVDVRAEAQQAAAGYSARGEDVPQFIRDMADAPAPQLETRSRWERCWIVLDNLQATPLSDELRVLLAGLIGARLTDAAIPEELRRLRWLFLGAWPDSLLGEAVSSEELLPLAINDNDMLETLRAYADGAQKSLDEATCRVLFRAQLRQPSNQAALNDPARRLALLQEMVASAVQELEQPS
jgi:Trypsin-like peptidase domain